MMLHQRTVLHLNDHFYSLVLLALYDQKTTTKGHCQFSEEAVDMMC